jgi:hypothetical protein
MTAESDPIAVYVTQTAALLGLSLHPDHQAGVIENFERMAQIAQLVMAFPLPEDVEVAPVFDP